MISREDFLDFIKGINGEWHGKLFHFTSVENLPMIRKMGGLCSMKELAPDRPKRPGGDPRFDPKDINWPYIFLNFTPATPMSYIRKRDSHLCIFVIDPIAACGDGVLFTRTNSSKKETDPVSEESVLTERFSGIEGLKRIYWPAVTMPTWEISSCEDWRHLKKWEKWEEWKFWVQAEALVRGKIPLSQVERVAFVSDASKSEGMREWKSKCHADCTSEEKLWAEMKFVVDECLFHDSPPFYPQTISVDGRFWHPRDFLAFPFPLKTWIRENPEGENPNAMSPVLYREKIDSVTFVAKVQTDSSGMIVWRHKEMKKRQISTLPEIEYKTVWSCRDGETIQLCQPTGESNVMPTATQTEFRVPIKELVDGPGSVHFEMRNPLWGNSWIRWSTLDFQIRSPNFDFTEQLPSVSRRKYLECFPLQSRFRGALILGAVGDALGWPNEFLKPNLKLRPGFAVPVRDFVSWDKVVGGKWWGYHDTIEEGEYSDDTQLTLAVARSISTCGCLMSPHFSYVELPLWMQYERGGGRAIKAATKWLYQRQPDWQKNFYRQGKVDYRMAGANGAAMRNMPISLAMHTDEDRLIRESIFHAIITHGHPRGILGTVLAATSTALVLNDVESPDQFIDRLHGGLAHAYGEFEKDELPVGWMQTWDELRQTGEDDFLTQLRDAKVETDEFLDLIPEFIGKESREYYQKIGALGRDTKGSGTGTVCSAIYLFLKRSDQPIECLLEAVNILGSDTDTVASILGGLLGAKHGIDIVPSSWLDKIQDRKYLFATADRLCCIAAGVCSHDFRKFGKDEAQAQISEWEDRYFCRMFSGELGVEDKVEHPTLGTGKIVAVAEREVPQNGYIAKLIRVTFDCGQSCVFHSRVGPKGQLSASLKEMSK